MLVALSACPPEAIREALHNQRFCGGRLGTNLLDLGALDEERLAHALGRLYRLPSAWGAVTPDLGALALVTRALVERHVLVPYDVDGRTLRLLVCDPTDVRALDEVAFAVGRSVQPIVTPEARVWDLMRRHYGVLHSRRTVAGAEGDGERRRWAPRLPRPPSRGRSIAQPIADPLVW